MTGKDEFLLFLDACRRRDGAATADLVQRYLPHVRLAIRKRLSTTMRIRYDSLDFAQEVWLSFFRIALDRKDLQDEASLIAYLCEMARIKVAEEYRNQTTLKSGLARTVRLELTDDPQARGPTPSAGAVANDEWEQLTSQLPERERAMLQMLRDGSSHTDTAAAFGLSVKTVRRLVQRVFTRSLPPGTPL